MTIFKCKKCKSKNTVKEPVEKPEFDVRSETFDYIKKYMTFSSNFLKDAVIEKAAREGIIIPRDCDASWYNLTGMYGLRGDDTATLSWREPLTTNPACADMRG